MDLFKVFFVILIAFTCQILAKPPINKNVESSKTEEISASEEIESELSQENEEPDTKIMNLEAMEKEVAHEEELKVNYCFFVLFVYFAIILSTFRLFKGQQFLNNMLRENKW